MTTRTPLIPLALKDAPALIETVFPAQKVSIEAQRERGAGPAQTLTSLGSYWKGRKPLILVRALLLGSLLPPTADPEADLAIFEQLLAIDSDGLARRALAAKAFKPKEIAARLHLHNPWAYFTASAGHGLSDRELAALCFPLDADALDLKLRWRRGISEVEQLTLYRRMLAELGSYEARAVICKRPEEVDPDWLYAPVWPAVNAHYAHQGIEAHSFPELVEQLGLLRYGHRPRVGDSFCGGGSIPFEAARLGCDVYASDLNPVACMLTWGALHVIGASPAHRAKIEQAQRKVAAEVDAEITRLGIEHDEEGNRAKAYLYCLETRCPETGWLVPLASSWVISKTRNVIARLRPDPMAKRFDIDVVCDVSDAELEAAENGTVIDGVLCYTIDGKSYRTPIKTLRGDYRQADGSTGSQLRLWEKHDFQPRQDDVFQERLYCVQWIRRETLHAGRQETWFAAPTEADLVRERDVAAIVAECLVNWQSEGLVPDMAIEPGEKTDEPIRTRGWTHWHHLFNSRQLLFSALLAINADGVSTFLGLANTLDFNSKLCGWGTSKKWDGGPVHVFTNQALNCQYNYAQYSNFTLLENIFYKTFPDKDRGFKFNPAMSLRTHSADQLPESCELWITDPPYADAVNYHEITEFFIAWLRKNPPKPFDEWVWDSRRALAIQGSGEDFRRGMVAAYTAMREHMPDNGLQCVMFTHQNSAVWSDLIGIFWAAGLQVVAAWYIATETTSGLKQGGFVQGTVTLMLKKRPPGERTGFKQRLLPAVRAEVQRQIEAMLHLNESARGRHGEPVWGDADLQMAGYAAALKVLTAYTHIGGEDVTQFALRPRVKGEVTVVDEIVQQAAETASNLLVPEGLNPDTWSRLAGIERFYCRMLDIEADGSPKLDAFQNFAKAFRVGDYRRVMADQRPNHARLTPISAFASRDLTDTTELGPTPLGRLIIALQQLLQDKDPKGVVEQLKLDLPDFLELRPRLIDLLDFLHRKSRETAVRAAAEVLAARLKNLRFGA